jgi:hypothetical protein
MNTICTLPDSLSDSQVSFSMLPVDAIDYPEELYDARVEQSGDGSYLAVAPIIVCPGSVSRWVVVDGCKRLQAARAAGRVSIACGVVSTLTDPDAAGMLRIMLNRGRHLHLREKLRFMRWLAAHSDPKTNAKLLADLGVSGKEQHELTPLLECDEPCLELISSGWLHIANVRDYLWLKADDATAFLATFGTLHLSLQTQRELVEWLPEIACAERITVAALLAAPEIVAIVNSPTLTAPQKIEKTRDYLHRRRFPRLTSAEKNWQESVRKYTPDSKRVALTHAPNFERDRLTIQVTITEAGQAARIFSALAAIPEDGWETLLCPEE